MNEASLISRLTDEQFDDIADDFETHWSSTDNYLPEFIGRHQLQTQTRFLAEIIRMDIDRRYSSQAGVQLTDYLSKFPDLWRENHLLHEIAFEDFRSRRAAGLRTPNSRWNWIPGIKAKDWYIELARSQSDHSSVLELASSQSQQPERAIAQEPLVGERFGEFQLHALIGSGAFSQVYLAGQSSLASRYVALKVVRKVLDEPTHLARLQHTGIVPLYSLHRIGEYSALCMPYSGSATLADWLANKIPPQSRSGQSLVGTIEEAQRQLTLRDASNQTTQESPIAEAAAAIRSISAQNSEPLDKLRQLQPKQFTLWFARRVASALAHAHDRNVVHGDLKPANILLRNDGEPALIDFNLSQHSNSSAKNVTGGTLPYMAPEQLHALLGKNAPLTPASDIFSFGIILFELINSELPIPPPPTLADSDIESALQGRRSLSRRQSAYASSGLNSIIQKCLRYDPKDRYCDANALLEDLDREANHLPLKHTSENFFTSRLPKIVRRHPPLFSTWPVIGTLISVVLLSLMTIQYWQHQFRAEHSKNRIAAWRQEPPIYLSFMIPREFDPNRSLSENQLNSIVALVDNEANSASPRVASTLDLFEQKRLQEELFDTCLLSACIALDEGNLTESGKATTAKLVEICDRFPEYAKNSVALTNARKALSGNTENIRDPSDTQFSQSQTSERTSSILIRARKLIQQGNAQQGLLLCEKQIPSDPLIPFFWLTVGDAHQKQGQLESARLAYSRAIIAAPESIVGYLHRGRVLEFMNNLAGAEADYTQAIKLESNNPSLLAERARIREKRGNLVAATEDIDWAIQRSPTSLRYRLVLARLLQQQGNLNGAKEELARCLRETPTTVEDWISRALAQLPRSPEGALADLTEAEKLEPNRFEVLQNLAHVKSEYFSDHEAAIDSLSQILSRTPDNEKARVGRAVLYARERMQDQAIADVEYLLALGRKLETATLYQIACVYSLLSESHIENQDMAFSFLAKALMQGYGADLLEQDHDLDPIRRHASFNALCEAVKIAKEPLHQTP